MENPPLFANVNKMAILINYESGDLHCQSQMTTRKTENISHSIRRPSSLVKPLQSSLMKRVSWFLSIMFFFFYFLPFFPCLYTCACKTSLYYMITVVTLFQQCQLFLCLQSMLALPIDIILCTSSVQ